MKVFAYIRKSTEESDRQVYSLDAQRRIISGYAKTNNIKITEYIEESHSAWEKGRPQFTEMLKQAKLHALDGQQVIIIAHKVDRLTRNTHDYATIEQAINLGIKFEFVEGRFTQDAAGRLSFGMFVLLSKYYSDNLSEEVKKGQRQAIERKSYPGNSKPGYTPRKPDKNTPRQIIPEQAWKIKEIFTRLANGETTADVYEWSKRVKFYSSRTTSICRERFLQMIRDPFYTGKFQWNGKIYQGNHPPIISEELFQKAQDAISGRAHKPRQHEYLFQNMVFSESGDRYRVTLCKKIYKYYRQKKHYIPESQLEEALVQFLKDAEITKAISPDIQAEIKRLSKNYYSDNHQARAHIERQLQAIDDFLLSAEEKYIAGEITRESYERQKEKKETEQEQLLEQIKKHAGKKPPDIHRIHTELVELSKDLSTSYLNLGYHQKLKFAKLFVSNFIVDSQNIVLKPTPEAQALLNHNKIQYGGWYRSRTCDLVRVKHAL
jgi:site-specific DNA recombinase